MTKKRLSDLLKEEVTKADAPGAAEAEAAPQPSRRASSARRTATSRRTKATSQPAAEPESKTEPESKPEPQPEPEVAAEPIAPDQPAAAIAPQPPANDMADRLSALEKDLAAAQKDKAQLEKTVAGLQKDLETQQGRLFELKDSLDQAETAAKAKADALTKTQAELDEAKKTILKLTETAAPAPHRISGVDILPRRPVEPKANRPAYHRGVPDYAIQKGQPNPMLTDADIGWVD
ncbi:hypothetical protein IQ265_03295 [Nodosilinea sp. LEGE 06152]|uniref:hypothetical protein n=1 Tax=Nodosilinea sp. LEGE 06152 TaxID=2777966 RepID=UPI0018815501|nr:hypothetical protein [Nodosilinea sp. LEGE 06152]MBE9155860.1 hypothetical protein [Nodosilinea sp. LEGE 06152]